MPTPAATDTGRRAGIMLGTMAQRTTHDAPAANRFARSGAILLVGTLLSNLLSYAFFAVLSRRMVPADLGGVGSLINLSVIAGIPALGLQLVTARLVAQRIHEPDRAAGLQRRLLKASLALGLGTAVALGALSPALAHLLDVPIAAVVVLGLVMVPIALLLTAQGLLQGRERFAALALILALVGIGKFMAALLADRVGTGVTAVVGLYGLAIVAVSVVGTWVALANTGANTSTEVIHRTRQPGGSARLVRLVTAAVVPTSGLLFLASVDVLLARHVLTADDSGQYTIGALFEKAAFWGTSFLATLFYPAMTDPWRRRGALLRALAVTSVVGVAGVLVAAPLGHPLARLVGGPSFEALGPDVWRFTALGVALSLVQVLAYAGVAAATVRMGVAMWLVAGAGTGWVLWQANTVSDVLTALLAFSVVLVAVGLVIERETLRPPLVSGPSLSALRRARSDRHRR